MMSYLARSCWIIGGLRLARRVFRGCVVCTRFSGRVLQQQMGQLPACRLTALKPFAYCGLDFAGRFPLRMSKGRGAKACKGYLAVFVCMAVHLELVSDLTTAAFLAAYARFSARRGACLKLFSDNGMTFRGAATELGRLLDPACSEFRKLKDVLASLGTSWEFTPP